MVKHLCFVVLFLSVLTMAPLAKNDNGASWWAGEAAAKKYTQEEMYRQTMDRYEAWKASNPDRELRLYDRIKKINKRTVRLYNTMIIGFVVLFGCILLLCFYVVALTKALSGKGKISVETGDTKAG